MANIFDRIKEKAQTTFSQVSVPIPITAAMLQKLIRYAELDNITNLGLEFVEESIQVTGKAKKVITFQFSFTLTPSSAEGRKLHFTVNKVKPLNSEWVRNKIFNIPPFLSYEDEVLSIDLNGFDAISRIPVGNIRTFKISDNVLLVTLGI